MCRVGSELQKTASMFNDLRSMSKVRTAAALLDPCPTYASRSSAPSKHVPIQTPHGRLQKATFRKTSLGCSFHKPGTTRCCNCPNAGTSYMCSDLSTTNRENHCSCCGVEVSSAPTDPSRHQDFPPLRPFGIEPRPDQHGCPYLQPETTYRTRR